MFLLDTAETLVSLVSLLSGRQRWKYAEHVALSISAFFTSLSLLASVSVFGTRQKISMSLRKCSHPSIEKCSQVIMLHSFSDVVCLFPLFPLKGGYFCCILVASYGHVLADR